MKSTIQLRQQLAFCQEDMARTLGVNRSKLVRAETCRGDLPTESYLQAKKLQDNMEVVATMDDIYIKGHDRQAMLKAYRRQKEDCDYMILRLSREQKDLEQKFLSVQNGLKMLLLLEAGEKEYPRTWLDTCKIRLEEKLSRCSPLVQARVKIKLAGLDAELRFLEEEIRRLEAEEEIVNQSKAEAVDQKTAGQSNSEVVVVVAPNQEEVTRSEAPELFVIPYAIQRMGEDCQGFARDEQRYILKSSAPPKPYLYETMISVVDELAVNNPETSFSIG